MILAVFLAALFGVLNANLAVTELDVTQFDEKVVSNIT